MNFNVSATVSVFVSALIDADNEYEAEEKFKAAIEFDVCDPDVVDLYFSQDVNISSVEEND